jgi:hypothetical protein
MDITTKTVTVKDLSKNESFEIEIATDKKVKELKQKIEVLINRKILHRLMIKKIGKRSCSSITDEELTIKEARIFNGDIIVIGC